ncbi:MAG: helix-turn-helix domain-containing GNAT family N-acetyltransferase [Alphaproteobacteria bacterium]
MAIQANIQIAHVDRIRRHSRALVRELGFMNQALAETDLSPSAVHAILEIGGAGKKTAQEIGDALLLEKSTVSRLLASLIAQSLLTQGRAPGDARRKHFRLTGAGVALFEKIERFARRQVANALENIGAPTTETIIAGLSAYADALKDSRQNKDLSTRQVPQPGVEIVPGYSTGLLGRMVAMHASFYARKAGFGREFETLVARDMAQFLTRIDRPANGTWFARKDNEIVGGISIDGEELGPGIGHIRWFIVDDAARGAGLGTRLMNAAMEFVEEQKFSEVHLWTFEGLAAARALYESRGFVLAGQKLGQKWGTQVLEQKFVWKR